MIYHLGDFDDLVQNGFCVIPKIRFTNLRKPLHDVMNIPASTNPLNVKIVERMGEKEKEKSFFDEIETIFHDF